MTGVQTCALPISYLPSSERGRVALSSRPRELAFDLLPTSYIFRARYRIRVTIQGADQDNFPAPAQAPRVAIHRGRGHLSLIDLPIIPTR